MKKIITSIIILMGSIFQNIEAQQFAVIGINNGSNSSTGYPAPFGNWYYGAKHQMYVTAAELIAAGVTPGSSILSAGFNVLGQNGAVAHTNFAINIYTSTVANPIGSAYVTTGLVASSVPTTTLPPLGWCEFPFSTSFTWNGVSNLIVETCFYNSGGYTYNLSTAWTSNLTNADVKTRWLNQDANPNICTDPGTSTSTNTRPDIRFRYLGVPCTGAPVSNTVTSPNYSICPGGTVNIGTVNTYTNSGLTYQWQSSTLTNVGPFTSVPSATLSTLTTPTLGVTTWYQVQVTCPGQGTTTVGTGTVVVLGTTTNTAPYYEGFEGVGVNDLLPNCSWSASGLGTSCQTYTSANTGGRSARTGSKFAVFNNAGGDFYSNGVYLDAGVTYSAALFYKTEAVNNYQNWLNMSIKVGPNQSQVSSTVVASTSGAAASGAYKLLDGTFTVATSGYYYVDVKATYTGGGAPYLIWDDLSITIPCQLNAPALNINSTFTTICAGQSVLLTVGGGTSYTWSNGSTGNSINVTPLQTTNYVATGVGVSGCSGSISQMITVKPTPDMSIFSPVSSICEGSSVNLTAVGAGSGATYLWSNNATTQLVTVSPLVTTTYSVYATNSFGCSGVASNVVIVNPKPNVGATASPIKICKGETAVLNGSGATTYSWSSSSYFNQGASVNVTPNASVVYTLTGNTNNCSNTAFVSVEVLECTGINSLSSNNSFVKVYPNPNNGDFTIELNNGLTNSIQLVDLTGRVVLSTSTSDSKINLNINSLSNGVYFVKIKTDNTVSVVKVVKQ